MEEKPLDTLSVHILRVRLFFPVNNWNSPGGPNLGLTAARVLRTGPHSSGMGAHAARFYSPFGRNGHLGDQLDLFIYRPIVFSFLS
jgi:hypothetical protein